MPGYNLCNIMAKKSLDSKDMLESSNDFEVVYKSYAQSIYRFLFWRTKNTELSEDLTSDVFEKAWRSRNSFNGGSARAWLYRIAHNVLIDHWRKKKDLLLRDTDSWLQEETNLSLGESFDKELALYNLQKSLNQLPREMQLVITLRFIEGLSCKQVAKKLRLSDSNVRVIQYRALRKIKEYMR